MHGELKKGRCSVSEQVFSWEEDITTHTACPCCKQEGMLRPHIVWFGEMPLDMGIIDHVLNKCDLFISIGTSGSVYPASNFVHDVRTVGKAHTVELNTEPSRMDSLFHEKIYGPATEVVPAYIKRILANEIAAISFTDLDTFEDWEIDAQELEPNSV
jgi:NAD-dependent deacetylase